MFSPPSWVLLLEPAFVGDFLKRGGCTVIMRSFWLVVKRYFVALCDVTKGPPLHCTGKTPYIPWKRLTLSAPTRANTHLITQLWRILSILTPQNVSKAHAKDSNPWQAAKSVMRNAMPLAFPLPAGIPLERHIPEEGHVSSADLFLAEIEYG